jgi:hypothetical protein
MSGRQNGRKYKLRGDQVGWIVKLIKIAPEFSDCTAIVRNGVVTILENEHPAKTTADNQEEKLEEKD